MQAACQVPTAIYCGSIDLNHYIKKFWPGHKEFLSQRTLTLVNLWGHSFEGPIGVLVRGGSEGMNPFVYRIPSPWEQEEDTRVRMSRLRESGNLCLQADHGA